MLVSKVLVSVFCDAHGILFIDYLEKKRTINSEYYMALLVRLKEGIAKKRSQTMKKKVIFLARQCTMSQVDRDNGKMARIAF